MAADERYAPQLRLGVLGEAGQQRLTRATVLVVGCGALGGHLAGLLARAGVGHLRVVDSDTPELQNLHRQVMYDEQDAARGRPKAEVTARRLQAANSTITVEPHVTRVSAATIGPLVDGVDLVLDGTDNLHTRYVINDACLRASVPWIYGGVVGTHGMTLTVQPRRSACLRCVFPEPPAPGSYPTSATRGILSTAPALIAALQATDALRLLATGQSAGAGQLLSIDLWDRTVQQIPVLPEPSCPACGQGRYEFL